MFFRAIAEGLRIAKEYDQMLEWMRDVWYGTARIQIEHNGNVFTSNVDKEFLLQTRRKTFEELGVMEVMVKYNDGVIKSFDEWKWHTFGNNIMKNVPEIKVIILKSPKK